MQLIFFFLCLWALVSASRRLFVYLCNGKVNSRAAFACCSTVCRIVFMRLDNHLINYVLNLTLARLLAV